ncbi:hypothetical protein KAW18_01310 [candidate division WOR-3 bacterium]|nr:hypothetical protein [candidate division WOR-3 bacterium]
MIVSLGVRTVDGTAAKAGWEIRTGATPGRAKLLEIGFFLVAATASQIGLGRPQAIGITPTTPVNFLPEDPNDVIASGVVQSSLAWATGPTVPTAYLRRISLPATVGVGVIWTFPRGITIPVSSSLILWNVGTNSLLDCYAVVEI